jgi:hypothetical protein
MSEDWLERYAAVYVTQSAAGGDPQGAAMAALMAAYAPNARYLDVPSNAVWEGRDGIAKMFVITYNFSNDIAIRIDRKFTDGKNFLLEGVATGTNTTPIGEHGKPYALPYASTGWFNDDGLVEEHHDHWDRKGWLVQIGAEEPTHWLLTEESWDGAVMDPADDFRRAGSMS